MIKRILVLLTLLCLGSAAVAFEVGVKATGAKGDGQTDDTAAFQAALNQAGAAGGGAVTVPTGRYAIKGHLTIPEGVTLKGTFIAPPHPDASLAKMTGSVLLAFAGRGKADAQPFITMGGHNTTLAGFVVYYPEWKQTDMPPVPYPPTIAAGGLNNVSILDCNLVNPYEAIRLVRSGRFLIRNVYGYPIWRGIYTDYCLDVARIENVHFWPFAVNWTVEDPYCTWINYHGVAFEFARTDWQYVANTFCYGYGVGYKFSGSPLKESELPDGQPGACNGQFMGIGADCCNTAVLIEATQWAGLQITNGEFVGRPGSDNSNGIEVAEKAQTAFVSLHNSTFWGALDRAIWMRGQNANLIAQGNVFYTWDNSGKNAAAIEVDSGKAIIQGNSFIDTGLPVRVRQGVRSAIVMGNQAEGGFRIDNQAGKRTQLAANEEESFAWASPDGVNHYVVDIGSQGEGRYLDNATWQKPSGAPSFGPKATMRWSKPESALLLPVRKGKAYTVAVRLDVPEAALSPEAGLYLDGKRLAAIDKPGVQTVTAQLPPQKGNQIRLEVRVKGWQPSKVMPGSLDGRTLGAGVDTATMTAKGAEKAPRYSANSGEALAAK